MIKLGQLFGLILSVSVSFQTSVLAESISENLDNDNSPIFTEIQSEVYPSVRRLAPLLNTWTVVAVLISTSSVVTVFVLFAISVQKIPQTRQDINRMKRDAISDLNQRISEAQAVVNALQYSIQSSQYKVRRISSETFFDSETEPD